MANICIPTPSYSIWFVDRADIWISQKLYQDRSLIEVLRPYCTNARYENRRNGFAIHLSQPKPLAFKLLNEYSDVAKIFRLELAWDFITKTQIEAENIENWLRSHLLELWRGNKEVAYYKTTRYSANRHNNQTAMYATRLSKIEKTPCVHLEWRLTGASAVQNAGFSLNFLATMNNTTHQMFWKKRTKFIEIDLQKLGRIILGRTRKNRRSRKYWASPVGPARLNISYDHFLRAGGTFLRAYGHNNFGIPDAQILIDVVTKRYKVVKEDFVNILPISDLISEGVRS